MTDKELNGFHTSLYEIRLIENRLKAKIDKCTDLDKRNMLCEQYWEAQGERFRIEGIILKEKGTLIP